MTLEEAQALLDKTTEHRLNIWEDGWILDYRFKGFWYSHEGESLEELFSQLKDRVDQ